MLLCENISDWTVNNLTTHCAVTSPVSSFPIQDFHFKNEEVVKPSYPYRMTSHSAKAESLYHYSPKVNFLCTISSHVDTFSISKNNYNILNFDNRFENHPNCWKILHLYILYNFQYKDDLSLSMVFKDETVLRPSDVHTANSCNLGRH